MKPSAASALRAILAGGLIAAAIDLAYALGFHGLRGIKLISIPQSIASGLLGRDAYSGGTATAALGVALHCFILLVAAAIYYAASRRLPWLRTRVLAGGAAYGLAIYLFMHAVVLPLSAAPKFNSTSLGTASDLLVHVLLLGPVIALAVRRWGSSG